ncbi:hypothetical protein [Ferrovum sp.]|uniref:hypothetical protein n=1 Tax=Ferrovum sp. TaxID=2609467 RepID=UPI00260BEF2F|nr:hypothetical protein [Ferrovum sp.]
MKNIVEVFEISALNGTARQKALDFVREGFDYPWMTEVMNSLRAFVGLFGIKIKCCSLSGSWDRGFIQTDAANEHFRGVKLSGFDREQMLTGFIMDSTLMYCFVDTFKQTGSAHKAFLSALDAFVEDVRSDMDCHYSEESLIEATVGNELFFTKDGMFVGHHVQKIAA